MSETDTGEELHYDLIVVGLGAMGAAVALHAQQLGQHVLGIDRDDPPHEMGSSHAETRMTRLAVGEGEQYLPFVARSHEIWRELEADTGERLFYESGGCIITKPQPTDEARWNDFVSATAKVAAQSSVAFEQISPDELRSLHPAIRVQDDDKVGLEPTGGIVMCERAIEIQLELAAEFGAEVHTNEAVISVEPHPSGQEGQVLVMTDRARYAADHVVLAAGPWMPELAGAADSEQLTVTRQVVFWFEVDDPDAFSVEDFPTVIWPGHSIDDYIGVFPIPPDGTQALKILGEQFADVTNPGSVDRTVSQTEIDKFYQTKVAPRLYGVTATCVKATVCLYTNTPDDHFFIDTDPRSDSITIMSPCSGHGFKHSAALGEAVAQQVAIGRSDLDLNPFRRRWELLGDSET